MEDNKVKLKIKLKNLADEARTIRFEENKTWVRTSPCDKHRELGQFDCCGVIEDRCACRIVTGHTHNVETRNSLSAHRKHDVRKEARATLIVYAFLRHKSFSSVEGDKAWEDLPKYARHRVSRMVEKYAGDRQNELIPWCNRLPVAVAV